MLRAEVYDIELLRAQRALNITAILAGEFPTEILLDNYEAVHSLRTGRSNSYKSKVDQITTLIR